MDEAGAMDSARLVLVMSEAGGAGGEVKDGGERRRPRSCSGEELPLAPPRRKEQLEPAGLRLARACAAVAGLLTALGVCGSPAR